MVAVKDTSGIYKWQYNIQWEAPIVKQCAKLATRGVKTEIKKKKFVESVLEGSQALF